MRKLSRLAFVLLTSMTAAIFCTLLLSSGFLTTYRRSSASRKEQVFTKEEKQENRGSVSATELPNTQFARTASLDANLLGRGFTDKQVKCYHLILLCNLLSFTNQINFLCQYYENEIHNNTDT